MSRFLRCPFSALPLLLVGIAISVGCGADRPRKPNLILITIDSLPTERLACFGGDEDIGHSLCRLGRTGTLFSWAMAPGRGLASSAASVLTGLPEAGHRVDDSGLSFLADARESIAERLGRAGYATAAFVPSPLLGRTRRLDQGFDRYDDRLDPDVDLPTRVQRWVSNSSEPYFVWIHLSSEEGMASLDRIVARLDSILEGNETRPGTLVVALHGALVENSGIDLASHRIPMIWSPPATQPAVATRRISQELTSLLDVAPTLAHAAGLAEINPSERTAPGRSLDEAVASSEDRYLLLDSGDTGEVGLASGPYVYVRDRSPFDGTGRPVPTSTLARQDARFLTRPTPTDEFASSSPRPSSDSFGQPATGEAESARTETPFWRQDVLSPDSPVPQLEFHLARKLREQAEWIPE